ncbi:MAG: FtsK/SpoIIIE family DNA translocase [Anaerolineaceae bacterium]
MVKKQISQTKSKSTTGKTRLPAKSTRAKSSARLPKSTSPRRTSQRRSKSGISWKRISNERKLDILGIILALGGFLTIFGLLSSQRSQVTGWWINSITKVAGWGTFVLPLALLVVGVWLILRNIEKFPPLSTERIVGVILLYLNILAWIHMSSSGGWEIASAGKGGGYIGAFFEQILTNSLGRAGAIIVLVGWALIALGLSLDISIPDLFRKIQPILLRFRENRQLKLASKQNINRESYSNPSFMDESINEPAILEHGFTPMTHSAHVNSSISPKVLKESSSNEAQPINIPAKKVTTASTPSSNAVAPPTVTQGASAEKWILPDIKSILDAATIMGIESTLDKQRGGIIEDTLASFGAPVKIVEIKRGPTITQFGVEPLFLETRAGRTRVRVSKIANLADDLALALAAPRIRIQAPVPGHNYVGIEVPNSESTRVTLLEVLDSKNFNRKKSPLRIALGMNVAGEPIASDLAGLPHLLIAGTTGSGKSVCVNSILCCLLLNNTPAELRLIMVDPKRVELTGYNGIPHLLAPVITDTEKVVNALQWIQREMDARYYRFSQVASRNIQEYNSKNADKLPYIVVVIDELADLMMLAPDETERSLTRLAQLARATGIHLILATQRPSTDVVTGLIKANFPARIAFAVASNTDSRVILDQPGAERLLGRGDMLFQAPDAAAPVRLQGVFITDQEIARSVDYWKLQAMNINVDQTETTHAVSIQPLPGDDALKQVPLFEDMPDKNQDPMLNEATELVRKEGRASITMLQRKLGVGYTRAARMIDMLEDKGIISPPLSHSNVREVLDFGQTAPPEDNGY